MWRHLAIGIALFTLSAWLWVTGKYTYEIACMIALLTIVWLYDRDWTTTYIMKEEDTDNTNATMKEVTMMTREQLDEQLESFLATAELADKKWIWNYFQDHDNWPIIVDELPPEVKHGVPGEGTSHMDYH